MANRRLGSVSGLRARGGVCSDRGDAPEPPQDGAPGERAASDAQAPQNPKNGAVCVHAPRDELWLSSSTGLERDLAVSLSLSISRPPSCHRWTLGRLTISSFRSPVPRTCVPSQPRARSQPPPAVPVVSRLFSLLLPALHVYPPLHIRCKATAVLAAAAASRPSAAATSLCAVLMPQKIQ